LTNRDEIIVSELEVQLIRNQKNPVHEFSQMKIFVY